MIKILMKYRQDNHLNFIIFTQKSGQQESSLGLFKNMLKPWLITKNKITKFFLKIGIILMVII